MDYPIVMINLIKDFNTVNPSAAENASERVWQRISGQFVQAELLRACVSRQFLKWQAAEQIG